MKIIDRKTFIGLPENTLFSKWQPCVFGPLTIKGESWEHDFLDQELADALECSSSDEFSTICDNAARTGASIKLDFNCQGRDGCFDHDQLFAVWEPSDVMALIERLKACLPKISENTEDD